MYVVAISSQKGGSGKTTLAGHLAVQAQRSGMGPVALIDADPQASLTQWHAAREADWPLLATGNLSNLKQEIEKFRAQGVNIIFIDTPPAITWTIIEVVKHSDLVLIPVRPSPHDLAAAGTTVDIVEEIGKPMLFVVNCASQRARITGEAAVALSQHGTVAPTTVHNRTDFAGSMIDGRTVMEIRNAHRSGAEIEALWEYVSGRLARNLRQQHVANLSANTSEKTSEEHRLGALS
jgi:chromosome partitioning protein